jgi:hypothetical protein
MKAVLAIFIITLVSYFSSASELNLPQGKGKCPPFSFSAETGWHLKSDRKLGDRWWLLDSGKNEIARFDYKIGHTDQKQLREVEKKELKLGSFTVEKYTVTTSFQDDGVTATEGLITSYTFSEGRLNGLVIMSPPYSKASGLDQKIEKLIRSID